MLAAFFQVGERLVQGFLVSDKLSGAAGRDGAKGAGGAVVFRRGRGKKRVRQPLGQVGVRGTVAGWRLARPHLGHVLHAAPEHVAAITIPVEVLEQVVDGLEFLARVAIRQFGQDHDGNLVGRRAQALGPGLPEVTHPQGARRVQAQKTVPALQVGGLAVDSQSRPLRPVLPQVQPAAGDAIAEGWRGGRPARRLPGQAFHQQVAFRLMRVDDGPAVPAQAMPADVHGLFCAPAEQGLVITAASVYAAGLIRQLARSPRDRGIRLGRHGGGQSTAVNQLQLRGDRDRRRQDGVPRLLRHDFPPQARAGFQGIGDIAVGSRGGQEVDRQPLDAAVRPSRRNGALRHDRLAVGVHETGVVGAGQHALGKGDAGGHRPVLPRLGRLVHAQLHPLRRRRRRLRALSGHEDHRRRFHGRLRIQLADDFAFVDCPGRQPLEHDGVVAQVGAVLFGGAVHRRALAAKAEHGRRGRRRRQPGNLGRAVGTRKRGQMPYFRRFGRQQADVVVIGRPGVARGGVAVVRPQFKHAVGDVPEPQTDFAAGVLGPVLAVQGQGDVAQGSADKDLVAASRNAGDARMQGRRALFRRGAVGLDIGRRAQRPSPGAFLPAVRLGRPEHPAVAAALVDAPGVFRLAPFLGFIDQPGQVIAAATFGRRQPQESLNRQPKRLAQQLIAGRRQVQAVPKHGRPHRLTALQKDGADIQEVRAMPGSGLGQQAIDLGDRVVALARQNAQGENPGFREGGADDGEQVLNAGGEVSRRRRRLGREVVGADQEHHRLRAAFQLAAGRDPPQHMLDAVAGDAVVDGAQGREIALPGVLAAGILMVGGVLPAHGDRITQEHQRDVLLLCRPRGQGSRQVLGPVGSRHGLQRRIGRGGQGQAAGQEHRQHHAVRHRHDRFLLVLHLK